MRQDENFQSPFFETKTRLRREIWTKKYKKLRKRRVSSNPYPEVEPEHESDNWVSSGVGEKQTNPKNCEIGLCNSVIIPGDHLPGTFDGEEVTEVTNVILKLKTMSNQPKVETDAGFYWWIDPDHLIQSVRYWKKRNHQCLKAISFPDIGHSNWE